MNLYDVPLFGMLRVKLGWLGERQQVLAQNVANADTADYKAKDLKDLDFTELLSRAHSVADASQSGGGSRVRVRGETLSFRTQMVANAEETPNGNSVNLEREMMKVSETQLAYQGAVDLYKKGASLLRLAIGR